MAKIIPIDSYLETCNQHKSKENNVEAYAFFELLEQCQKLIDRMNSENTDDY